MTIYGILCGLTDFTNIADFLKIKEEYFTQLLNLEHGTPSHDCLSDVFAAIDSKKFMEIFIEWTKEIIKKKTNKNISIDGKAIKSVTEAIKGGHYVFKVKENQRELQKDIRRYFDKINNLKAHKDIIWKEVSDKKNHGRIEKRNYYLSYDVNSIKDKKKWETIKGIAYERVERTIGEETSITDNYYIIVYKLEIDKL